MSAPAAARERVWTTPPGVRLGLLTDLPDPGARGYVLQIGERFFHGFVVRRGEVAHGWVDRCPHAGLPLAQQLDAYLTPDGAAIACSWHGAVFAPDTGACLGGPCAGGRLTPWPVTVREGWLVTG